MVKTHIRNKDPCAEKEKEKKNEKEENFMPEPLALRKLCFTRSHSFASPARTHDRTESHFPYEVSLKA